MHCDQIWEPSHSQNLSNSPHLLSEVQQSSFHKVEETAWAAYTEGLPTGPWNPRLNYKGNLTCDVKGLAWLMAVGQNHLHVTHFCSYCPCCSLCLSAIHFSMAWTTTFDYSILWPSGFGQPLSAMNSMSQQIPWHGSCIWVVRQPCTRTAQTAPMTSGVTTTGQDQERWWTKRISRGLHQDKPCSSPHHRISILVSMKCYWTLSLHQFRYGCSMMLITARMWL